MPEISYKHTPITEAVIGMTLSSPLSDSELESINKKFNNHYPDKLLVPNISINFTDDSIAKKNADFTIDNMYRRSTSDMAQLLVLGKNGLTFSQLAPYPGWDIFYARFVRDWKLWKRELGFRELARVGIRFINRIDIPFESTDLSGSIQENEYLNIHTTLPNVLGNMDQYSLQAKLPIKEIDCSLVLNSGVVASPLVNHMSFLLDLDISTVNAPPKKDEEIFELLENIRTHKNRVFELCITDKTREIYLNDR